MLVSLVYVHAFACVYKCNTCVHMYVCVSMYAYTYMYTHMHSSTNCLQAQLDEQLIGLQTLTAARRSKLQESIKLHQYIRDVDEVLSWLTEKQAVAASDDYGKDFEHLLVNVMHMCILICMYGHT